MAVSMAVCCATCGIASMLERVHSHNGPIGRRKRGYILTTDQLDAGHEGIFSRRTNQTQDTRVYSHDGPASG
eukprot:5280951-Pyramimonas_sp.AAC.1